LYVDATCRRNPDTASIGFMLKDNKGEVIKILCHLQIDENKREK
jgi:ribonuclease HI